VVALGGCLPLAGEHLGREQERAAVDGRLLQALAERDDSLVQDPDPGPLRPGGPVGGGIDEHGRLPGRQKSVQRSFAEEVVGGEQHEQRLAGDRSLDRGQRRAVAVAPLVGIDGPDPAAPQAADNGRDRSGVVADDHQDPLQPSGEQGPHGPLDQAQATQPQQGLGAAPGEGLEALGPAGGEHHTHPRQPRRRRVAPGRARPLGKRRERIRSRLRCAGHPPASPVTRG
jgi:hypothetical protein